MIDDLDTVPIPDRDLIDQRDFVGLQYSRARPNTEMVITRGCPIRCVFCANPVFRLRNGPTFPTITLKLRCQDSGPFHTP